MQVLSGRKKGGQVQRGKVGGEGKKTEDEGWKDSVHLVSSLPQLWNFGANKVMA